MRVPILYEVYIRRAISVMIRLLFLPIWFIWHLFDVFDEENEKEEEGDG